MALAAAAGAGSVGVVPGRYILPMRRRSGFRNRRSAGEELAGAIAELEPRDPVVLGLARGGVVVAKPVAHRLHAPLDVFVVRKLGLPSQPELAMGAIAEGGFEWINSSVVNAARVSADELDAVRSRENAELTKRVKRYRGDRPAEGLADRTAILIDDGLATGSTARVAIQAVRSRAESVWFAAPVGAPDTVAALASEVDEIICLLQPSRMMAVGVWYSEFDQVTDDEVVAAMGDPGAR